MVRRRRRRCLGSLFHSFAPPFLVFIRDECFQFSTERFPEIGLFSDAAQGVPWQGENEEKKARRTLPLQRKRGGRSKKKKKKSSLTGVSSEAILAPLGSVVSCVSGAGELDDAGTGSVSPGSGSVMGTPEEKKRREEAAAAAIGATTAEVDDDAETIELLDASAEAAARPARGSRPVSREAALEDETMADSCVGVRDEKEKKEEDFAFFFKSQNCDWPSFFSTSTSSAGILSLSGSPPSSLFLSFLSRKFQPSIEMRREEEEEEEEDAGEDEVEEGAGRRPWWGAAAAAPAFLASSSSSSSVSSIASSPAKTPWERNQPRRPKRLARWRRTSNEGQGPEEE